MDAWSMRWVDVEDFGLADNLMMIHASISTAARW